MRQLTRTAALCLTTALASCRSHPHSADEGDAMRDDLRAKAGETLARLDELRPGARAAVEGSSGYAVFTDFGARLLVVGTARGQGIAIDNRTGGQAFMRMTEVSAGIGPSIKKFDLVWAFTDPDAFAKFVDRGWQFQAVGTAAAKAGDSGGAWDGALALGPGVYVYQLTDSGLALELTLKGAKFYHDKGLN
jgi:lipid-binding SYLF domain-containing protein